MTDRQSPPATPALMVSRKAPESDTGFDLMVSDPIVEVFVREPSATNGGNFAIHVDAGDHGASVFLDRDQAAHIAARLAALLG